MAALARRPPRPYVWAMRAFLILLALPLLAAAPAATPPHHPAPVAAPAKPAGPKAIGTFEDWTAATNTASGQTECYAFVRASQSAPAVAGRGEVVLTVTQRSNLRDAVAVSAGFAYAANAPVTVQVDQNALDFFTSGRSAFARDGHAAVAAFQRGRQVSARSPAPRNTTVVDTFSLKGFSKAYDAINKACPAK
jgi:invasion protein IalB